MRAAIDELARTEGSGRRVAVLGDMLELGPEGERFHRELGAYAREHGVELLLAVGPLAGVTFDEFAGAGEAVADARAATGALGRLLRAGDTVLVKGSRGIGLEQVVEALARPSGCEGDAVRRERALAPGASGGRG
jgi:UDP-N-acetylmuramoyl-tripeptide--D-alanyl-D-alanine ligase